MESIGNQVQNNSTDILESLGLQELQKDIAEDEIKKLKNSEERTSTIVVDRTSAAQACKADVNFLGMTAAPSIFKYKFPLIHLAVWQLLTQRVILPRDFSQLALGLPRGSGKTMLIKLFILYCILFTNKKFIVIVAATATLAENLLADVFKMLSDPNIRVIFGDYRLGIVQDTQAQKRFGFRGRDVVVAALGAGGSIRGLNVDLERPDVMVFDDIQAREQAKNKLLVEELETWMIGTAMKSKSPHGCLFVYIGNMYPYEWTILKKLKSNPQWVSFITGGILEDGTALWEELQPLKQLLNELENDMSMGHPEIFFAEVMNDITVGINTNFNINDIPLNPYEEDRNPQGRFIIIDPATDKPGSDLITMGSFAVFDGSPVCDKILEDRMSPGETIRKALMMAFEMGARVIAVETTGYQYSLLYWFNQLCLQYQFSGFHFVELFRHGISKNSDIKELFKKLKCSIHRESGLPQPPEQYLHSSVRSQFSAEAINWNPLKRDNKDGILDVNALAMKCLELHGHLMHLDHSSIMQEATASKVLEFNSAF